MAGTSYDSPVVADGCDVVTRVATPAVATSPRGLLSVASITDEQDPVRWGVTGALYESYFSYAPDAPEGFGSYAMDCDNPCPSPEAGASANLELARATAYTAWTRIACTGPQTDALEYARNQYAVREERLLESILDGIVGTTTPDALSGDLFIALGQIESAFASKYAGQGTVWLNNYIANALAKDGLLMSGPGNSLLTPMGNRVAISPVFNTHFAMTPNLSILRSSLDVLDFFNRGTNMQDALAQRQYLFIIDPATDVVSGNIPT